MYSIAKNSWETFNIAYDQQLTPREKVFSFQINPSCILIAGGCDDEMDNQKDCYALD